MKIYSVTDSEFHAYGKVIEGYDTSELLKVLNETTPIPEKTLYVAKHTELQSLPVTQELSDRFFGGMPIQMGWCNGHNTKLNCLEYHRNSEVNLGTEDFILLLGRQEQIDIEGFFDTANVRAFRVPAGVLVEVYATTLHYAPCSARQGEGFRVLVALPEGTNTEKPEFLPVNQEDRLMTARNKWLLAHPDSEEASSGAQIGLKGENIDIQMDI